jgi:hypothetical protein
MKKAALALAAIVALAVVGVLGMAMTAPDVITLERSITVAATTADIVPFATDLKNINAWSPWDEKDPNLIREYSDPSSGVGATYHWTGNDEVGEGTMTLTSITDGRAVMELHFLAPFDAKAEAVITWAAQGDGTNVTWGFNQKADLMTKVMTVFVSFEDMLGPDYELGLAKLKPLVEAAAIERVAAEKAAAQTAAAAAATAAEVQGTEEGAAAEGTTSGY